MDENTVVSNQAEQAAQGDAAQGAVHNEAEVKTETGVTTGAAVLQEKTDAEKFSFALKKRVDEELQKREPELAKKYESDLKLAQEIRNAFTGKSDSDIVNDLTAAQVKAFAAENSISEGLAREIIELRRATKHTPVEIKKEEPASKEKPSDTWAQRLQRQREAIQAEHGVDVLAELSDADEAAVLRGEMDLNEVFARRSQESQESLPSVNRGTAAAVSPKTYKDMTDDEYDAFRARLRQEGQIPIRSD